MQRTHPDVRGAHRSCALEARQRRRTGDGRERPHLDRGRAAGRQERRGASCATRDRPGGAQCVRGACRCLRVISPTRGAVSAPAPRPERR
jgi:hypothetical protein